MSGPKSGNIFDKEPMLGDYQDDDGSYQVDYSGNEKFTMGNTGSTKKTATEIGDSHLLQNLKTEEEILAEIEKKKDAYLLEGDHVYELFAVSIHSGGASGGHYYACIKSFEDGEWYKFNDRCVTRINHQAVIEMYGNGKSGTNAYMLQYRRLIEPYMGEISDAMIN